MNVKAASVASRARRLKVAIAIAVVAVAAGVPTWLFIAERLAVAALLRTGASVAFESDIREAEVNGFHSVHTVDERNPLLDALDSLSGTSAVKPGQGRGRPSGRVKLVDLPNDEAVRVVLRNRMSFSEVESVSLDETVGESAARRLFEAIFRGDLGVESVNSHVPFARQTTLDTLLQLPLKNLLICRLELPEPDLSVVRSNTALQDLWISEDEWGDDHCRADPLRYDTEDLAAITSCPRLNTLYLGGLSISREMADALANATRLKTLYLCRCRIAQEAVESLRSTLPNTVVSHTKPSDASAQTKRD